MAASKLKVIILIPVFERQCRQWCGVGKFQISKVPVQYLSIPRRQINIAGKQHITYVLARQLLHSEHTLQADITQRIQHHQQAKHTTSHCTELTNQVTVSRTCSSKF